MSDSVQPCLYTFHKTGYLTDYSLPPLLIFAILIYRNQNYTFGKRQPWERSKT